MLIEKYNPEWKEWFEKIKLELENTLIGIKHDIQHVGSTSVPDLDAKPIIDIDIIFQDKDDLKRIKASLEKIGYFHNGNQGIEDREVFKRDGLEKHGILDAISHHLYAGPINSQGLKRHLLTRDALINNAEARSEYQLLKYDLAVKANQDQKRYAALKELHANTFLDRIIEEKKTNKAS